MLDVELQRRARLEFDALLAIDEPAERARLLHELRARDPKLHSEIERLLAADVTDDGVLTRIDALVQDPAIAERIADELMHGDEREPILSCFPERIGRYRINGVLGTGGMGIVYAAEQESPHRPVALKVMRPGLAGGRRAERFKQEVQILALLHHPGIAQIFDAGTFETDEGTRPFFAMELVAGMNLLEHARVRDSSLRDRVELVVELCQAVHHAHLNGIVHRDLKPGNVLVEPGGQLKVLDFGVARLLDAGARSTGECTLAGEFVGTLAYMSPEHFSSDRRAIDPRSDVYSIGVIAFELLGGSLPYDLGDGGVAHALHAVRATAPTHLSEIDPQLRGDLEIVVAKALEKEKEQRYSSAVALADDLERFLRDEPILARPPSTTYQLRKFARRNKALSWSAAALLATLIAGLAITSALNARLRRTNAEIALRAAPAELELIEAEAAEAWPPWPDRIPTLERLATRMTDFVRRRGDFEHALDDVRARGTPSSNAGEPGDGEVECEERMRQLGQRIDAVNCSLAALSCDEEPQLCASWLNARAALMGERDALLAVLGHERDAVRNLTSWRFEDSSDQALHGQLCALLAQAARLDDARIGARRGTWAGPGGWSVTRRLELAHGLGERTVSGADARRRWRDAIASIADVSQCPAYGGLTIEPQIGLLPLARDTASGLWEFWDVLSGDAPARRRNNGSWEIGDDTAMVLVLIPGADFVYGVQKIDPSAPNFDALAQDGAATRIAHVDPFFLSKYEMTQGQWTRLAGSNPAICWAGSTCEGIVPTLSHPIENVTASECARVLRRIGMCLPTNEQWEFAARTSTRWGSDAAESSEGLGNFADASAARAGSGDADPFDDGYAGHAPVGTYRPNPFGLYDTLGNVYEFVASDRDALYRGGCFANRASRLTCGSGGGVNGKNGIWFGVRPARLLPRESSANR